MFQEVSFLCFYPLRLRQRSACRSLKSFRTEFHFLEVGCEVLNLVSFASLIWAWVEELP